MCYVLRSRPDDEAPSRASEATKQKRAFGLNKMSRPWHFFTREVRTLKHEAVANRMGDTSCKMSKCLKSTVSSNMLVPNS